RSTPFYEALFADESQASEPDQTDLSTRALRTYLNKYLPGYMIPSAFVMLDALPVGPSGKVDRKALPAPNRVRDEMEDSYVAPRTVVEEQVARIWADILGLDRVGVHDNYFELGGHSLLA